MDPRTTEHAEIIVNHCTTIERGDDVVIKAPPSAEDLVVALHEQIGDRGADPVVVSSNGRAVRAFVQACDAEDFSRSDHLLALLDAADVFIGIKGPTNTKETVDVDPEKGATHAKVQKPLLDAKMDMRWVGTQYPAPGNAQAAEMSTAAYADFVWNAIIRDWDAQRRHQEKLVDILAAADKVRIESGRSTDIRMTVDGMTVENDYGRAYERTVPDGRERNDSAIHQDMILDVSEESTITVDGETLYSDGTFVFEGDSE